MSHYKHHVFFCANQRDNGKPCCNDHDATEIRNYVKDRIAALGLKGEGKIRINSAGCMDRCELGPVLVIYPEAIWYRYDTQADVDEIIQEHLIHGRIVSRLQLP